MERGSEVLGEEANGKGCGKYATCPRKRGTVERMICKKGKKNRAGNLSGAADKESSIAQGKNQV